MAKSYAYVGAPSFIGAVEGRLADAGFSRVSDVASADIVVTFATSSGKWWKWGHRAVRSFCATPTRCPWPPIW